MNSNESKPEPHHGAVAHNRRSHRSAATMHFTPLDIVHPVPVRLWLVQLETVGAVDDAALDTAERARAARFRFETDRSRYIRRRKALRELLGSQLGMAAARVPLRLGENEKPELDMARAPHFNASHHGDFTLIGLCDHAPIGVDIEGLQGMADIDPLAQNNLSPTELADFRRLDPAQRESAFLTAWTRKEACLKSVGTGLAIDLRELHTGTMPQGCVVTVPTSQGKRTVLLSSHRPLPMMHVAIATRLS